MTDVQPSYAQARRVRAVREAGDGLAGLAKTIPLVCRLPAEADVAAMTRAVTAFVARHEALRHRFAHRDGIVSVRSVPVAEVPCVATAVPGGDEQAMGHVRAEVDRPFDVLGWPLLRAGLVRSERPLLYLSMDHLVADAWSVSVAMRDLRELYDAAVAGRPPDLPDPGGYLAYSASQRRRFADGPALDAQVADLQRLLAGRPLHPPFPVGVARWDLTHGRYARLKLLNPAQAGAFARRCREEKSTVFMGVLAALGLALKEVSGRHEAGVLVATHNRDDLDTSHAVGWYANMLPLYFPVTDVDGFAATLRNVRANLLAVFEHHELPLARILQRLPDDQQHGVSCFVSFTDDRDPGPARARAWRRVPMAPAYRAGYGLWVSLNDGGLTAEVASPRAPVGESRLAALESALAEVLTEAAG
ncbi:condensation domain-containing protein [Sphaerisporangium fuscum]|uniref:condensation domain-containing protein n=1 Tax=Sphaerisporangium fuscum TaxID=2835868 RepID=UPI001BDC6666|nr:condensation domain-containing protein [Sphaerisporangium fuscum]